MNVTTHTFESFLHATDFKLLAAQKSLLLSIAPMSNAQSEAIDGILQFIDGIQDVAVDSGILSEAEVFPETNESAIDENEFFEEVRTNHFDETTGKIAVDGYFLPGKGPLDNEEGIVVAYIDTKEGNYKLGDSSNSEYLKSPRVKEAIKEVLDNLKQSNK